MFKMINDIKENLEIESIYSWLVQPHISTRTPKLFSVNRSTIRFNTKKESEYDIYCRILKEEERLFFSKVTHDSSKIKTREFDSQLLTSILLDGIDENIDVSSVYLPSSIMEKVVYFDDFMVDINFSEDWSVEAGFLGEFHGVSIFTDHYRADKSKPHLDSIYCFAEDPNRSRLDRNISYKHNVATGDCTLALEMCFRQNLSAMRITLV